MSKLIEKKTWPDLFERVLNKEKLFDARLADDAYNVGDILVLKEWDPSTKSYTGREIRKKITFKLNTKQLREFWIQEQIDKYGIDIMSLADA